MTGLPGLNSRQKTKGRMLKRNEKKLFKYKTEFSCRPHSRNKGQKKYKPGGA